MFFFRPLKTPPYPGISIRDWFARPHDSNSMIGKCMVHVWQVDLRHVTRRAVLCSNRASSARMFLRGFGAACGEVARQALLVVSSRILRERLVRIVAGHACDSRIAIAPALAAHQPVRL